MDVGCGTGILSIFCAYAGARKAGSLVILLLSFRLFPIICIKIQTMHSLTFSWKFFDMLSRHGLRVMLVFY